jgi:tetratricopeptide (TPR) repeat protein
MRERSDPHLSSRVFVGREPEIIELQQGLTQVLAGANRLFLISGEPGIGKTRLADELSTEARARGVRVIWGRCWEGEGAPAYWPWIQIFRTCVGNTDSERLDRLIGIEAPNIAALAPELAGSRGSSALTRLRPAPAADLQEERFQLFDSAARLLRRIASAAPLVLVLDDLQEADQSSLLMLRFIARELKDVPILILGTFREAEVRASPALRRLIGEIAREGHQIVLRGFSQTELAQFVAERIGVSAEAALVIALMQATGGNPLFVDGALRMLIAERKELNGDRLSARDFKLPDAVAETIRRRLSFLSAPANALLSIGAVVGQEFEFECLRTVTGKTIEALVEAFDEARRDGLLYSVLAGNLRYRFAHDLIRETIYEDIPAAKRTELHWEIAETLEQIYQADSTTHSAAIAHHYRESVTIGSPAKAIDYSIRAGEAALAVSGYEETRRQWQAAAALMERYDTDVSRRTNLLRKLGVLTYEAIDVLVGIADLEAALKLTQQNGDERNRALIHLELGQAKGLHHGPHLNVPAAMVHYRAAQELIDPNDPHLLARLYRSLSAVDFEFFLIDEGLDASERAMELYRQLGDISSWSITAAARTRYLMVRGRHMEAASLADQIREVALATPEPGPASDALWAVAVYYVSMRAPLVARHLLTLGLEKLGLSKLQRQHHFDFLALAECLCGDLPAARACHPALPSFQARILLRQGDWDGALALLREQFDLMRTGGSKSAMMDTLSHLFETLCITGDHDGAWAVLPKVLEACGSQEPLYQIRTHLPATLLSLECGKTDEALEHLKYCRRIVQQGEDWLGFAGSVARTEAALAAAENRMADAARSFEHSMTVFKKFGLVWEAADTLHLWGRALLKAGKNASALEKLDAAMELYRRHGAGQRWIQRVEVDRRRTLDTTTRPEESQFKAYDSSQASCCFYPEGDYWVIAFSEKTARLKDAKGFHHIAHLLRHPGVELAAADLAGSNSQSNRMQTAVAANGGGFGTIHIDLGDAGPQLDAKAKADYARRIRDLRAELDEAQRFNDPGKTEVIRGEIEALTVQLKAATGLRGDRRVASHVERARSTVSKRIRFAIRQIQKHNPQLGNHLTGSIRTGHNCAYLPKEKIDWRL